jgi:3-oxoacyl-(acyl-carrier-protein) synthase
LSNRVVITGLGVVSPNGTGINDFLDSIRIGKSGIRLDEELKSLNFQCHVSGRPEIDEEELKKLLPSALFNKLENEAIKYSCLAGAEAWVDAGLGFKEKNENPDWESGVIFGCGALAMDTFIGEKFKILQSGLPRKVGSRVVEQTMNSGAVTYLNKIIGFGNLVTANSSACATGTEAIILGYERIKSGRAKTMLCGSCESQGAYIWSGFEAMRILCSDSNDNPTRASRPMSSDSTGFVPGTGAGALVLEDLDKALKRGATRYGEIVGGEIVNGGQRNGGSITANNPEATVRSIHSSLQQAGIFGQDIDLICGHLTSTIGDSREIESWTKALNRSGEDFPLINSLKSMIGHCLGASGSIELVAAALQLKHSFVHPIINAEEINPNILTLISKSSIPTKEVRKDINYLIKASLGFGDVNSCIVLKKWK